MKLVDSQLAQKTLESPLNMILNDIFECETVVDHFFHQNFVYVFVILAKDKAFYL